MNCLISNYIFTPNGILFYLLRLEVELTHELTPYRNNGWDEIIQNVLNINGR